MDCSECIKGSVHAGQPQGTEEVIHGLNTYIVGNRTNPRGIIVVYSDVFGLGLPNNRIISDAYAASGEWLVYLPDFFKGDPVPLRIADVLIPVDAAKQSTLSKYTGILANVPSYLMWASRHKQEPTDETCMEFMEALRRGTPANQKIGMVGMCWGGRYALRAGLRSNMIDVEGNQRPLVDAVVALHPSNLVMPSDVDDLVVPASIGWGVEDSFVSYTLKGQMEDMYAKQQKEGKSVPEIEHKTYTPGRHGFSVRGNPDDPAERKCLEDAEAQVLAWMNKWL